MNFKDVSKAAKHCSNFGKCVDCSYLGLSCAPNLLGDAGYAIDILLMRVTGLQNILSLAIDSEDGNRCCELCQHFHASVAENPCAKCTDGNLWRFAENFRRLLEPIT